MSYLFIVFVVLVPILHYIFHHQVNSGVLSILINITFFTKPIVYVFETRHCLQLRQSMLLSLRPYISWIGWLLVSVGVINPDILLIQQRSEL